MQSVATHATGQQQRSFSLNIYPQLTNLSSDWARELGISEKNSPTNTAGEPAIPTKVNSALLHGGDLQPRLSRWNLNAWAF